ncbi:hypothetical protein RhiTH_002384 [Rhizoctonia solani]
MYPPAIHSGPTNDQQAGRMKDMERTDTAIAGPPLVGSQTKRRFSSAGAAIIFSPPEYAHDQKLSQSPLNYTGRRALVPTRIGSPIKNSMFHGALPPPRPTQRPSNALRAFGAILPGSTPQSYRLSTPLRRDSRGRAILEEPEPPNPKTMLPVPPPGIAAKKGLGPRSGHIRVMVHRMNLSRNGLNTSSARVQNFSGYMQIASQSRTPTIENLTGPVRRPPGHIVETIDGIRVHTKRMAAIEDSEKRREEARVVAYICASIRDLAQRMPDVGPSNLLPLESNHAPEDTASATVVPPTSIEPHQAPNISAPSSSTLSSPTSRQTADMSSYKDQPLSTEIPSTPSALFNHQSSDCRSARTHPSTSTDHKTSEVLEPASPPPEIATTSVREPSPEPAPQPRQKRSRVAPAPYSVPPTRVLRSMTRAKDVQTPVLTTAPSKKPSRKVAPDTVRSQAQRKPKVKRAQAKIDPPPSASKPTPPTTSRYNLRPRKRGLDSTAACPETDKQPDRPIKRRRT